MMAPDKFIPPAGMPVMAHLAKLFTEGHRIAEGCYAAFYAHDHTDAGREDPSNCPGIFASPGVVIWSSKMAIDADGAAMDAHGRPGKELDPADGQNETTYRFASGASLSSEGHSFAVIPLGDFREDTGLQIGDVMAILYGNVITYAIIGDLGPPTKIGEASIRVHEAFKGIGEAMDPCKLRDGDGYCKRIHDVSIPRDVVFFAFPDSRHDLPAPTPANLNELVMQAAYGRFSKLADSVASAG